MSNFLGRKPLAPGRKADGNPQTPARQQGAEDLLAVGGAPGKGKPPRDTNIAGDNDPVDARTARRLARAATNPYNDLQFSEEEEESKSPDQIQQQIVEGLQQPSIEDTPGSDYTDYQSTVRVLAPSRPGPPPNIGQQTSFTPFRLANNEAKASLDQTRRDSSDVIASQTRDEDIASVKANFNALAARLDKTIMNTDISNDRFNARLNIIEHQIAAASKENQERSDALMQLILARLPPIATSANPTSDGDDDPIPSRKRSDSSIPSNASTPKGPDLLTQPIAHDRPRMHDTSNILQVGVVGVPGVYDAVVDHEAGTSYIQKSLPLAQYIESHAEPIDYSDHNYPIYDLNFVIRTRGHWRPQQRLNVVVGDWHDPPSVLVLAPEALIEDIASSANSTVSSAYHTAGILSPEKRMVYPDGKTEPRNSPAIPAALPPPPKGPIRGPIHSTAGVSPIGDPPYLGNPAVDFDPTKMSWNYSLRSTSPRVPILVPHREVPLTVVASAMGSITQQAHTSGYSPSDPNSLYAMRFNTSRQLEKYFKTAEIPQRGLPNLYKFLTNVFEPLCVQYAATPADKKLEVLYPSVYACMTQPWKELMHSLIGIATTSAEDIQLIQNRLASDNTLLFSVLVHAMDSRPLLDYCCLEFYDLSDPSGSSFNKKYAFPDLDDHTKIPGWFLKLASHLALFLDFAIYAKEDLPFIAKTANNPAAIASAMTTPKFPFRESRPDRFGKVDYRKSLCSTLPFNAFFAHKLFVAKMFEKPIESIHELFQAVTAASDAISAFARQKYQLSMTTAEPMRLKYKDVSFFYNNRKVTYKSESSATHSDNLSDFFEFFKDYFCSPHNFKLSRYFDDDSDTDTRHTYSRANGSARSKPPVQPTTRPVSDYVSDEQFAKLTPKQQSDLIEKRKAARQTSAQPASPSKPASKVTFEKADQKSTDRYPRSLVQQNTRQKPVWTPREEFRAKSPEEQAKLVATYNEYKQNGAGKRPLSPSSSDSKTTIRASALSPAAQPRDWQPQRKPPGQAYLAQVERLAYQVAESHPTFNDYFVGNADAADEDYSESDKEPEGDAVDVLIAKMEELDAYNDDVMAHSARPALLSDAEDSDYYDAADDPNLL